MGRLAGCSTAISSISCFGSWMRATILTATPDRCKCHDGDQYGVQGVEANALSGCLQFQNTAQKVRCGVVNSFPCYHHTIATICAPVCENQSIEIETDTNEGTHRRLVWALMRNCHGHHEPRRRHQRSNFTCIPGDAPHDSWAQLPCLYDMLNTISHVLPIRQLRVHEQRGSHLSRPSVIPNSVVALFSV